MAGKMQFTFAAPTADDDDALRKRSASGICSNNICHIQQFKCLICIGADRKEGRNKYILRGHKFTPAGSITAEQAYIMRRQKEWRDRKSTVLKPQRQGWSLTNQIEFQKNMIGNRIYRLIRQTTPEVDAGKITGMLLEMECSDLLRLLESPEALYNKVGKALELLEAHIDDDGLSAMQFTLCGNKSI